jgi:hypothetical protein
MPQCNLFAYIHIAFLTSLVDIVSAHVPNSPSNLGYYFSTEIVRLKSRLSASNSYTEDYSPQTTATTNTNHDPTNQTLVLRSSTCQTHDP